MEDPFKDAMMLTGKVERHNRQGTGFILDCRPEEWMNKSKLRNRRQDLPPVGSYVEVPFELYNESMYMIDWRFEEPADEIAGEVVLHADEIPDDKPIVTRLACLNAALNFWSPGKFNTGEAVYIYSEANILGTAEVFVVWAKGASIPDALAAGSPSETPGLEPLDQSGSPGPTLSGSPQ